MPRGAACAHSGVCPAGNTAHVAPCERAVGMVCLPAHRGRSVCGHAAQHHHFSARRHAFLLVSDVISHPPACFEPYLQHASREEAPPAPSNAPKGTRDPTPHLDRIREESVVFARAYAASSACSSSRFAVLTGRYPSRSKIARGKTRECSHASTMTDVTVSMTKLVMKIVLA